MKLRENELTTSQSDGRFSSVAIRPLHSLRIGPARVNECYGDVSTATAWSYPDSGPCGIVSCKKVGTLSPILAYCSDWRCL